MRKQPLRRFKVYIGETNNMARRHGWEYRAHGDHLAPFFEAALNDGATIWRRVRYTVSRSALRSSWADGCRSWCQLLARTAPKGTRAKQTMLVLAQCAP